MANLADILRRNGQPTGLKPWSEDLTTSRQDNYKRLSAEAEARLNQARMK